MTSSSSSNQPILGIPSTMNDSWQLNLHKLFQRGAVTQPTSTIVTKLSGGQGYHRMNYRECEQRSTRIASALALAGIQVGDRVGSFMWNNGRHLLLYYGVPSMGCVLHTLNIRLHPTELAFLITHTQDRMIFVDCDLLPLLEAVPVSAFANVEKLIVCGENMQCGGWKLSPTSIFNTLSHLQVIDFEVFESTGDSTYDWPELSDKSAMALCYTSGTTGDPKGVAYSHRSTFLHTLVQMSSDVLSLTGYDCVLPIVPFFHALGWGLPFTALTMGFKLLLMGNCRDYVEVLDMCLEEQCTAIAGVPTVMQAFRSALSANPAKYASMRGVLTRSMCGGSAPPADLIKWFYNEWSIELVQAWGMTETNPLGTIARRLARRRDLTATEEELIGNQQVCGVPPPLIQMKIVNPDNFDEEVARDGVSTGELLVRGPFVTAKYFRNPAPHKFHNGWLVTGDIASITADDQMLIRDRSKDMIKSGGEWISSIDMENFVMALEEIELACVVAVPHPKWDERPVAVVQLKANAEISKERVLDHLREKFSKFQLPDDVLFREIPLTGSGKMSKKNVRKQLKEEGYVLPSVRAKAKL